MIFQYKEISKLKKKLKGKPFAFTSGCFDLLHVGHLRMLEDARRCGEPLVVGIFPDEYVRAQKGNDRPVHTQKTRAQIINTLKPVDYVLALTSKVIEGKLPIGAVRALKPPVYVTRSTQWKKYAAELQRQRTFIKLLRSKKVSSTTRIISKIKKVS